MYVCKMHISAIRTSIVHVEHVSMMPIDIYDAAHIPKSLSIRSCVPVAQWIGTLPFHYDAVNSLYYDAVCRTCFAQICL